MNVIQTENHYKELLIYLLAVVHLDQMLSKVMIMCPFPSNECLHK